MREYPLGGLYEVGVGVHEMLPQIQYWERFGYHVDRIGGLAAEEAAKLYGVDSSFRAVRLAHLDADHGYVRLMEWAQPVNDGLGLSPLRCLGSRWATQMTANLLDLMNHVVEAQKAGWPLRFCEPLWDVIYQDEQPRGRPFHDPMVGVREMFLLQPLARQVFFERFNYVIKKYGKLNYSCLFQTSQAVHFGLVTEGGPEQLDFYDDVLGLLRVRNNIEYNYEVASGREMFDLKPGERYFVTDFDDPRSSPDLREMRSGRLHVIRFPEGSRLIDCHEFARPGCLGFSLYTYRVSGLELYHKRVGHSAASNITDIYDNEFGERSFSFTSPDGYFWTLVED